jgi:hypothetical protein
MRLVMVVSLVMAAMSSPALGQDKQVKGSCGAFCEDAQKGKFTCEKREKPTWNEAKHCTCEAAPECAE